MRIAFVTFSEQPGGTRDDELAAKACAERGMEVTNVPWDHGAGAWDEFSAVVVRSTWNYHREIERFQTWIDRVEASEAVMFNDPDILRWNAEKSYLFELSERGVPIIPSVRVENSSQLDAREIRRALGTPDVVVKPLVGAWGDRMFRLVLDGAGAVTRLEGAAKAEPVLVQRYLPEIVARGEWSLVYLGGRYSHALRKTPADGEFRVHEERGGVLEGRVPPEPVRQVADLALGTLDASLLYARVDLVESGAGPLLMELELIEPALYFEFGSGSADRFAEALEIAIRHQQR
ncbi:MAG: ATP-grasp domain-containing protein [Gemmatimonadota bacterium]